MVTLGKGSDCLYSDVISTCELYWKYSFSLVETAYEKAVTAVSTTMAQAILQHWGKKKGDRGIRLVTTGAHEED
jgi:hypothetical protein